MIDFKGSTRVKQKKYIVDYFLQCGFYGLMFEELFQIRPKRAVIIMAAEQSPTGLIFQESMDICIQMVNAFMTNPIGFQEKMKAFQKNVN